MLDFYAEDIVKRIANKLRDNTPLSDYEKEVVIGCLYKAHDVRQEPYAEVVYHDEYGNCKRRIMNPVSTDISSHDDYNIVTDYYDLVFRRIERK